jgi:hypothetical protein
MENIVHFWESFLVMFRPDPLQFPFSLLVHHLPSADRDTEVGVEGDGSEMDQ